MFHLTYEKQALVVGTCIVSGERVEVDVVGVGRYGQ